MSRSRFATFVLAVFIAIASGCLREIRAACSSASFSAPSAFNMRVRNVAVADLNGDSYADVVAAADSSTSILVMISNGPQGFLAPVAFSTGGAPAAIAVGDFNNDQKVDLVTAHFSPGNISILLGNGVGGFAAPMNISVGNTGSPAVEVGDFNGDQNQDLVVANSPPSQTSNTGSFRIAP